MKLWPFKKKQSQAPVEERTRLVTYSVLKVVLNDGSLVSVDTPSEGPEVWQEFYDWYESAELDSAHVLLVSDGAIGVARRDIKYVFVNEVQKY